MKVQDLLVELLTTEYNETEEEALRLVKSYPEIVITAIMWPMYIRSTAVALQIRRDKENKND